MAVICRDCKFWDEMRIRNRGTCRRFPSTIETAASHWCGEHKARVVTEAILEPEYEATELTEDAPRKVGRPKKKVEELRSDV
jgi:hypothetical protein